MSTNGRSAAIIGMAGRFAGASNLDEYWRMLCTGIDAITEVPPERYDVGAVFDPTPRTPGRTVSRWGGFVTGPDRFDAEFFGVSPREAIRMDPQQRMLLEVTYEALEDAGQSVDRLAGGTVGVFVGQLGGDYWHMQYSNPDQLDFYAMTGAASRAMMSGRLSYAFDLRGPSLTLDTACSSSLVAIHLAMQSLRTGECDVAIAAGVNLILLPEEGIVYSGAGMLARDGRCKFGDASGDGFVRSDGVGAVVLKRLDTAMHDEDRVRAVVLGSASGNDGRSSGYLVTPGVEGQRRVLAAAYRDAGVEPGDVDVIEAHGTGTRAGDPVEFEALGAVLKQGRPEERPCLIGSVKTNIGHAEAAAGIASVIKAVLSLEHGSVPPSLHFTDPNPAIPWADLPFQVPRELTPLPRNGRPLLAGVSSFGISGSNAHLVLAEAPRGQSSSRPVEEQRPQLLTLSAASEEALTELAGSYAEFLTNGPGAALPMRDIVASAGHRRSRQDVTLTVVAEQRDTLAADLHRFAGDGTAPADALRYRSAERPRIAFVFPGQGSQWLGMGRELLADEPVFREAIEACDTVIAREAGWSLLELLQNGSSDRLAELDVIQPTLWAIEVALAALWRSWGVEPDVVIGHSMGEAAAAYVAGALSLDDAGAVICRRSRIARRLSGRGAMAFVELPAAEAAEAIAGFEDRVAVAAANSPAATLLSGDPDAIAAVVAALDERDVFTRLVNVDFASHSPQIDEITAELREALADLRPRAGNVIIRSTLLNERIDGTQLDADYWCRNIREPVDLVGAVGAELDADDAHDLAFIETSPHPILVTPIRQTVAAAGREAMVIGSLRRDEPERRALLTSLVPLVGSGIRVDWPALAGSRRFVDLPRYPWQHQSYWLPRTATPRTATPRAAEPRPAVAIATPAHPLLGPAVTVDGERTVWEGPVDLDANPYLRDHQVQGVVILPGTAYLELFQAAARTILGDGPVAISDVAYRRALFLSDDTVSTIRVTVDRRGDHLACAVHSRDPVDDDWLLHVEATARAAAGAPADPAGLATARERATGYETGEEFYPRHAARGNQWNGAFQAITEVWRGRHEAVSRLRCPDILLESLERHWFHPALLDACGHSLVAARPDVAEDDDHVFVLGSVGSARFYRRPGPDLWSHAVLRPTGRADSFIGDVRIFSTDGGPVAELTDLRLQYLSGRAPVDEQADEPAVEEAVDTAPVARSWLHSLVWRTSEPDRPTDKDNDAGVYVVLIEPGVTGRRLVSRLQERGARVVIVTAAATSHATGSERFRVDPERREDLVKVLREIDELGPCRAIVHMWGLNPPYVADPTSQQLRRIEALSATSIVNVVRAVDEAALGREPRLWIVTLDAQAVEPGDPVTNAHQALAWGMGRSISAERPTLEPVLADVDHEPASAAALAEAILSGGRENQVAFRRGRRLVARLVATPTTAPIAAVAGAAMLTTPEPGLLDDVQLMASPVPEPGAGEVVIEVAHAALNYRDILMSLGLYPGQSTESPQLGWECAGTITAIGTGVDRFAVGDEVIALAPAALATHVRTKADLVAAKPRRLTLAQAATVPGAYLTAYYALHELARIAPGERVLVHTATGGVGLAAIQIARWKGAEVFATAGSDDKRRHLAALGIEHVADSRSTRFADEFRTATAGRGLDVILNTLTGDAIQANLASWPPTAATSNSANGTSSRTAPSGWRSWATTSPSTGSTSST